LSTWTLPEISPEELQIFSKKFKVSPLAAKVFIQRSLTRPEELRFYLDKTVKSTHNPFLFSDMENVLERLNQAVEEEEKILVFGDRDVDGITSAALMVKAIESHGGKADWRLPMDDEAYGLTTALVQELAEKAYTLLITVDCGITNLDEIDLAQDLGIDVIVIDHHNPLDELPAALGIIDPKIEDDPYPFEGLCAAALVSKVVLAWDFSQAPWYGQEFCLINLHPGTDFIVFEAVRMRNMAETARLCENIANTSNAQVFNRILPFIQGYPLLVYEKEKQVKFLKELFKNSDIYLEGLEARVHSLFPELAGKSLLRMAPNSKLARFSEQSPSEIDVLKHLFTAVCQAESNEAYLQHEKNLGLVALSTIADMAPLKNENRILLKKGIETLPRIENPGLIALMRNLRILQEPMQAKEIGWKLSPAINSSGRLGRPDIALRLLLSQDQKEINELIHELDHLNESRKEQGEKAWGRLKVQAASVIQSYGGKIAVLRDDEAGRGITGILAARLAREYRVPSLVITRTEDRCVGSIRSLGSVKATELLAYFSDLFSNWGGHDAAGGFSIAEENYEAFLSRMLDYVEVFEPAEQTELYEAVPDLELSPEEMTEDLWPLEECFMPYGQESAPLLYLAKNLLILDAQLVGKNKQHVKLTLKAKDRIWPAVFWNAVQRIPQDFKVHDQVHVLFHLEKNTWGANTTLQMNVQDIIRSQAVSP